MSPIPTMHYNNLIDSIFVILQLSINTLYESSINTSLLQYEKTKSSHY